MREVILKHLDENKDFYKDVAHYIWENPEIGFEEYKASEKLMDILEKEGFKIEKKAAGLDTAFIATKKGNGEGPTLAIMSEYDALVGIGHACGHNLFSVSSVAAAIALGKVMDKVPGTLKLIGTPAEEGCVSNAGAKAIMIREGAFEGVDAAMMCHAEGRNIVRRCLVASATIKVTFYGKPAHAGGSPHEGINALTAGNLMINNINGIRQQFLPRVIVNPIIEEGGIGANTIPDKCVLNLSVRADKKAVLNDVLAKIENCAKAGALVTGCTYKCESDKEIFEDLIPNEALSQAFQNVFDELGVDYLEKEEANYAWDVGNVSYVCPTIGPYIKIGPETLVGHTDGFREASNSEEGYNGMILGAKAMALTALDYLTNEKLQKEAKEEFSKKA